MTKTRKSYPHPLVGQFPIFIDSCNPLLEIDENKWKSMSQGHIVGILGFVKLVKNVLHSYINKKFLPILTLARHNSWWKKIGKVGQRCASHAFWLYICNRALDRWQDRWTDIAFDRNICDLITLSFMELLIFTFWQIFIRFPSISIDKWKDKQMDRWKDRC